MRTRRKSKGLPKADWVYRQSAVVPTTGALNDALGTYDDAIFAHTSGPANAQSHVLYDSQNWVGVQGRGGFNTGATPAVVISRAGRAEGSKPLILRTEGMMFITPVEWTAGGVAMLGARIGAFEQDLDSGVFSLDAAYSMWQTNGVSPFEPPAQWANIRRTNRKEWRWVFNTSTDVTAPIWRVFLSWSGRARLESIECWGLYTELDPVYTTFVCDIQLWMRSLVVDES